VSAVLPTENMQGRLDELRRDLLSPDGPQLSVIRAYRFAIFHYAPDAELEMRRRMAELSSDLDRSGWKVIGLSAVELFLKRVERECDGEVRRLLQTERRHFARGAQNGLEYLQQQVAPWLEGKTGIAADVAEAIRQRIEPGAEARTVAFIGRLGAFYPFYRTSALLRFLDNAVPVPVILLYPGYRVGDRSLSFMGAVSAADSDYRPHIY
jgi:hypothetical protein